MQKVCTIIEYNLSSSLINNNHSNNMERVATIATDMNLSP